MIPLQSELTNRELEFAEFKDTLERRSFMLGGNWEYHRGSFDRRIDGEQQTVWLRIPFEVVHGMLDPDAPQPGTRIVVGTPYVLRHQYNEGDDHTTHFFGLGSVVDQFQSPSNADADVQPLYVTEAQEALREIEAEFH